MPRLFPVSWPHLVNRLHELEFEGPYQGGKHPYMIKGDVVLTIPNPHRQQIGVDLLQRILKQGRIMRREWLGE